MTHSQEETLAAYGEHDHPGVQGRGGIDDAAAEQVEALAERRRAAGSAGAISSRARRLR